MVEKLGMNSEKKHKSPTSNELLIYKETFWSEHVFVL